MPPCGSRFPSVELRRASGRPGSLLRLEDGLALHMQNFSEEVMTFCGLTGRCCTGTLYLPQRHQPPTQWRYDLFLNSAALKFTMEANICPRIVFLHQRPIIHSDSLKN